MPIQLTQYSDIAYLILRLAVAAIFIYHAVPKLKSAAGMSKAAGMPAAFLRVLGAVELVSAIALIVGLWVQVAALLLAAVMLGALYFKIVKWHVPFFAMDKNGWEFDLILLAANIALFVNGGGGLSV